MTHHINVTPSASADLEDIRAYLATNSEAAAERTMNLFEKSIKSLVRFPRRHTRAPEAETHYRDIRHMIVGKHRILYWVVDETVHILRVRHVARKPFEPGELN